MLEAANADLVFTISLKRSTLNLQLSTSSSADYPIYVKRHKNDAVDAEAICEAVTRTNMRFVATKTPEQRSSLTLHRTRHLFIRYQTSVINAILTSGCRVLPGAQRTSSRRLRPSV